MPFLILAESGVFDQAELFSIKPPEDYHLITGQEIIILPCVITDGRQGKDFTLVSVVKHEQ